MFVQRVYPAEYDVKNRAGKDGALFNACQPNRSSVSAVSGVPLATSRAGPGVAQRTISSPWPGFCKVLWLSGTTVFPADRV